VLFPPGLPVFHPHPRALGYAKRAGSPFITEVDGRLITTRVLTERGEAEIHELPRQPGPGRPRVYCPFCGLQGKYRVPKIDPGAFTAHFAHDDGNEHCVEGALESIRHRLAKAALLAGLRILREARAPLRGEVACLRCRKPFVRELLGSAAWTTEREEVTDTASMRRPDVLALAGTSATLFFEVHVSHRVDAEKNTVYETGDLPGIELDAAVLLDEENKVRWTSREPLGLPIAAWHLDREPRAFSICGECRSGTEELRAIVGLVSHMRRTSPSQADVFLHRAAARLEVSTLALHNSGPEAILQAMEAPEALRRDWGAAAAEAVARKVRWPSARNLLIEWLALKVDPWTDTPLLEVLANPYGVLTQAALRWEVVPEDALRAADLISEIQGLSLAPERLSAHAGHIMAQRLTAGHTAWDLTALTSKLSRVTRLRTEEIALWLQSAAREEVVLATASAKLPAGGIGLVSVAQLEARVEKDLRARRVKSPDRSDMSKMHQLSKEQRHAVEVALDYGVSVITGGPGTGKTFVIKSILKASMQKAPNKYWRLAAPTNKAVQRLREVTGMSDPRDARTVHAWLGRKAELQDAPPYGLIVDEASFLDLKQMADLLEAAKNIRRLVLVGDPDQLPSIGFGAVLRDLKSSGKVRYVELTQVRRAEEGRGLVEAAQAILASGVPMDGLGVRLVEPDRDGAVVETAFREYERLVYESGGRLAEIQALAPTRELVERLNTLIRARYNERGAKVHCAPHLRVGDRVVCTDTIYGTRLVNGIQGVVAAATAEGLLLKLEGENSAIAVREEDARVLSPAYVMTVHKAQGSEWPSVLIALDRHSQFIDRSLLYTAATRAKRTLVLVATREHLEHAVRNVRRRETQLVDYIIKGASR
jgi:hypothetical protein